MSKRTAIFLLALLCILAGDFFPWQRELAGLCADEKGTSLFARLIELSPQAPQDILNLLNFAELSDVELLAQIRKLPPSERFHIAAGLELLAATEKHSSSALRPLINLPAMRDENGRLKSRLRPEIAKALGSETFPGYLHFEQRSQVLKKYFQRELSVNERLEILKSKQTFADPFNGSYQLSSLARHPAPTWREEMSLLIDAVYGLDIAQTESKIAEAQHNGDGLASHLGPASWSLRGLSTNHLNTTYLDMEAIFSAVGLKAGDKVVDLGAAYHRVGLFLASQFPEVESIGFELNPLRVQEGNRVISELGYHQPKLYRQDLSANDFQLPPADIYFAYDPVNAETRKILFEKLYEVSRTRKIRVIVREGRNDFFNFVRNHPWLTPITTSPIPSGSNPHTSTLIFEAGPG